jgi:hypothetical protein
VKTGGVAPRLSQGLGIEARGWTSGTANSALSVSVATAGSTAAVDRRLLSAHEKQQVRALAGAMFTRLGRDTVVGLGIQQSSATLGDRLSGDSGPAFLIGRRGNTDWGFASRAKSAFALRHQTKFADFTVRAETGEAFQFESALPDGNRAKQNRGSFSAVGISADRSFGPLSLSAGLTTLTEDETVLGARFGGFAGITGARTVFADAGATIALGRGWSLGGTWRQGWTRLGAGGLRTGADHLRSSSWSLDLGGESIAVRGDRFGLRIAQPLRISRGGFDLSLPTSYDYATRSATIGNQFFNLAPTGREIDVEAAWSLRLGQGWIGSNLYWRRDPGNNANVPNDVGMAVRYSLGF